MKTIARTTILIFFSLLVNYCSFAQLKENNSQELFVQFKDLFHKNDLPINWNLEDVGRFAMPSYGQKSRYNEIPEVFFSLIPKDLIESDSTSKIRALYQLVSKNDIHLFVIVTDYMHDRYNDGELYSILTQLFLMGYDNSGNLLFHKFIAGRYVDKWDKLFKFNLDYTFETSYYEFLYETMKHPSHKHQLIELIRFTKEICEISVNGILNCKSETIKGYFESTPEANDYELVKIYDGK